MERLISEKLYSWKANTDRKPLVVRGARQVGKTYSIREFGKKYYKNLHIIDLERDPDLGIIFKKNKNPKRILTELEIFLNNKININSDLLFIDEIQNSPEALSSLRYFYEEIPELNLITAGSLIEFALRNISFPVGRIEMAWMYPMNFSEFLLALNKNVLHNYLSQPIDLISDTAHDSLLEELRKYFLIGGMPEAVKIFTRTESFIDAQRVQTNLLDSFKQDFSKYAGRTDKRCLEEVLLASAKSVGKQTKYSRLAENFSAPTIKNAYHLLLKAKVINKVFNVDPSGLPLGGNTSLKNFKTIFLDIGLLNRASELTITPDLLNEDLMNVYEGALAEQFVGQEMLAAGLNELYFWSRNAKNSSAEVDYVFSKNNKIVPIEVKKGPSGKLKSMHLLLNKYSNIKEGIVLSSEKYSAIAEQKLKFIPIYLTENLIR